MFSLIIISQMVYVRMVEVSEDAGEIVRQLCWYVIEIAAVTKNVNRWNTVEWSITNWCFKKLFGVER